MADDKLDDLPILREIGADLRAAATRADGLTRRPASWRQRPRLRPSAALGVAALAIVAGVLLVANPGGSRLDPVAQAQAALDTEDAVLHMVVRGGMVQPDGSPVETMFSVGPERRLVEIVRRTERWVTSRPVRTRLEQPVRTRDGTWAGAISQGTAADGTRWTRTPDGRLQTTSAAQIATLEHRAAETAGGGPSDIRQDPIAGDEDPTVALRRLFDSGRFEPGAERVRDGRKVRDLVASEPGQRFENGAIRPDARTVYTVDAESFAPVEIRHYRRLPGEGQLKLSSHTVVETFERLDADDLPADLFEVPEGSDSLPPEFFEVP